MSVRMILNYLLGNRAAIEHIARDRNAVWYGLFFALISGVAREYDQESVLFAPHLFLAPVVLAPVLAAVFYAFLRMKFIARGKQSPGRTGYLGLFLMTAPMGWLYALPFEVWLPSLPAMKCNVALLVFVATWRVVLFARVIAVVLNQRFWVLLCNILWGGAVMVGLSSFYLAFSLTDVMGGTIITHRDILVLRSRCGKAAFSLKRMNNIGSNTIKPS